LSIITQGWKTNAEPSGNGKILLLLQRFNSGAEGSVNHAVCERILVELLARPRGIEPRFPP
jgi:hypothetical protein